MSYIYGKIINVGREMRNIEQILEDYLSLKFQYNQINSMRFLKLLMSKEQRRELDRIKKNIMIIFQIMVGLQIH